MERGKRDPVLNEMALIISDTDNGRGNGAVHRVVYRSALPKEQPIFKREQPLPRDQSDC